MHDPSSTSGVPVDARDLADRWARSARRLRKSPGAEDIHAFRTACRRLLARLPESADGQPDREVQRLRRRLKRLLKAAAPLRESHVLWRLSQELWPHWEGLPELRARLRRRTEEGGPPLTAALGKLRIRRTRNRLLAGLGATRLHPWDPRLEIAAPLRGARRDDAPRLHRLRLRVKRLRYLLEAVPPWPDGHRAAAALQEALGTLHDLDELAALRTVVAGPDGTPPEDDPWRIRRDEAWTRFLRARRDWLAAWQAWTADGDIGGAGEERMETEWLLLRHGPAGQAAQPRGPEDRDRPLTAKGLRVCRRMAEQLVARGWTCRRVLSSPLARALQTAEAVCEALGKGTELVLLEELGPDEGVAETEQALRQATRGEARVVVVGHEPLLSTLAARLAAPLPDRPLRKAGLIRLAVGPPGQARLLDWLDPGEDDSPAL